MSSDRSGSVALGAMPGYSRAFVALASGDGEGSGGLPATGELVDAAARRTTTTVAGCEPLWAAVESMARRLWAGTASRAALADLQAGASIVICGQQPGLLGGPAFTLYKIATAIALARRLSRDWRRPVVPVFWNTTYDTDFAEVAGAQVAGRDLRLRQLQLDAALHRDHRMVGGLPAAAARPLLAELSRTLESLPGAAVAEAAATTAWERGGDWGEGFSALLYHLFAAHELVVIDGREPVLRQLAQPLIARYVERASEFGRRVEAHTATLVASGWKRQLAPRATTWSLLIETGDRRHSFDDRDVDDRARTAPVDAADLAGRTERHAARAGEILAGRAPGSLWPGVALRPLVADHLLPTVAHVMGPAEVAYMNQLVPAYELLEVGLPPVMPRLTMTWVPAALLAATAAAGISAGELVSAPAVAADRLTADSDAAVARAAVDALRDSVEQEFALRRKELLSAGRGVEELVDAVRGRIGFQLERLQAAVAQRQRAALRRRRPELPTQLELIAPRQKLQERQLAWLGLLALTGPELTDRVLAAATEHVDAALGGRAVGHRIMPLEVDGT